MRKFGADCFCVCFFHLPDKRNVQTGFFAQIFGAQIFAPIFAQIFGTQIIAPMFAQIFGAQIFAQIFVQISRRFFFDVSALEKSVFQSHVKMRRKSAEKCVWRPNGPVRGGGGTPFHLRFLKQTARHTIAVRPAYSRRACERPS